MKRIIKWINEKVNFKVRFKNPVFIAQLVMSVLFPILTYMNLTVEDLTSWGVLGNILLDAIMNPYVIGLVVVSVWNAFNDPTTKGLTDSARALGYRAPADDMK